MILTFFVAFVASCESNFSPQHMRRSVVFALEATNATKKKVLSKGGTTRLIGVVTHLIVVMLHLTSF